MFLSDPELRVVPQSGEWRLAHRLVYVPQRGKPIAIPAGFVTDLASIPRILQGLIPVNGKHRAAAILHDYLYVTQRVKRAKADALFLEAMKASGVSFIQSHLMYAAVRVAGGLVWSSHFGAKERDRAAYFKARGLRNRR